MKKIKVLLIVSLFAFSSNVSTSEEQVNCNDIKKYLKKIGYKK